MAVWLTLLKQAPALLAAANAVFASTRAHRASDASADVEALRQRLVQLENTQQASAELLKQLADHATAMAQASQVTAVRARQALVVAVAGLLAGVAAMLLAWWR